MSSSNQIDPRLPSLRLAGVAVERFSGYVNTSLKPHSVPVLLFSCVLEGRGAHHMDDAVVPVGPGSVGMTTYGQKHDLVTGPEGMDVVNVYADLVSFDLPVVPAPWDRTLASIVAPDPAVVHRQNRRVHLQFDEPIRMRQPLEWMLREQQADDPGSAAVVTQLFSLFLVECCRVADRMGWRSEHEGPGWVEDIRQHLDRSYDHQVCLDDLADRAGVSPEHLCRCFRRYTGKTPMAYLNDRRTQHAMWLLRTTNRTVTDIAWDSGFRDLSVFNRRFKASTGKAPTAYRADHSKSR